MHPYQFYGDHIRVQLRPSPAEIETSKEKNLYLGPLTEFYDSIKDFYKELHNNRLSYKVYTDTSHKGGAKVSRENAPDLAEILILIHSSGIALCIYNLLKLWINKINGRRIKIVTRGFEIEATQLSQEQFVQLLEEVKRLDLQALGVDSVDDTVVAKSVPRPSRQQVRATLEAAGYQVIDEDDLAARVEDSRPIREAKRKKMDRKHP